MSAPGENKKYIWVSLCAGLVAVSDQWTKWIVVSHMRWTESWNVIPGLFAFTYVRNTGAAFGLFRNAPTWFHDPFFIAFPVAILFFIAMVVVAMPRRNVGSLVALGLVFGGAVGNLADRMRLGYVVDFLDFYWRGYHWPAFNIADSAVVVGIVILTLASVCSTVRSPSEVSQLNRLSDL